MKILCKKAIKLGDFYGKIILGNYYKFIDKNYIEAEILYKEAVENGHTHALHFLADFYEFTKDYTEMEKLYKIGIQNGNTNSMNALALYHERITKDYTEMLRLYKMAAEGGSSDAVHFLSKYYRTRDLKEKEGYLIFIIDRCNFKTMCSLGFSFMYNLKESFPEVNENPYKYYIKAVHMGFFDKFEELKKYCETNNIDLISNLDLNIKIPDSYKNIFTSSLHFFKPTNIISKIYNGEIEFCKPDFQFITNFKIYDVHSFVLDSEYFKCLLSGPFASARHIEINLRNEKSMEHLLKYLYLGEFNWKKIEGEILDDLLEISDYYGFLNLFKNCKITKWLKS